MAQNYGPTIVTDGLVLNLDAADINSYPGPTSVDVLVVAGGGGGGMDIGGGGGGGGVVYQQNVAVTPGAGIAVTVGAGGWGAPAGSGGYRGDGAGPQPSSHQFTIGATAGGNSVFGSITALGGGFGASSYFGYTPNYGYGGSGGSGGGASGYSDGNTGRAGAGTAGQGYNGGGSGGQYYSGGGGGAGAVGVTGPSTANGGDGIRIPEMSPFWFAGGGGGSGHSGCCGGNGGKGGGGGGGSWSGTGGTGDTNGINPGVTAANGPYQFGGNAGANTGGGGGGGTHYNYNNGGGNGGSGIVIVRYKGPQGATGGNVSYRDGYTYHTFLSSGTFTPGANNIWYDTSGNGNNATLYNSPTWNSAGYFTFDGTNDYAEITFNSATMAAWSSGQTIIVWEYHTFNDGSRRNIWNQAYGGYGTWTHEGGYNINYYWGDAGVNNEPYTSINSSTTSTGVWNMLATTRDTSISNWYVNAVNTGVGANPYADLTATTANISIGIGYTGTYWVGNIAKIMVYNRALSAAEILQNYNAQKTRFGR